MINFGKYKGRSWDDVAIEDPHYLDWVAREGHSPWARRSASEALTRLADQLIHAKSRPSK